MNEIEKKIQEAGQIHRISKNSDQILEAFEKKHSHRIQKKFFFIPAITTLLSLATAVAVIFAFNPRPIHLEGKTNGLNDGSTVLTSLTSDLSIHYYFQPSSDVHNRIYYAPISQSEFYQVASDIDDVYYSFAYYESHRDGFNYTLDSAKFKFDGTYYNYELFVNNTTIYLKDNLSKISKKGIYDGLIRVDDKCYPCEIEAKVNKNHVSTAFRYRISNQLYELYHEELNQKTRITYKTYIDEEIALTNYVDLSYNSNIFNASFVNDDVILDVNKERSFSHKNQEKFVSVDYKKKTETNNVHYENIKLTVSSTRSRSHTYSYDGVEDVVL